MTKPEQLAEAHWQWVDGLFRLIILLIKYVYKTAFIHGYKHGQEDKE